MRSRTIEEPGGHESEYKGHSSMSRRFILMLLKSREEIGFLINTVVIISDYTIVMLITAQSLEYFLASSHWSVFHFYLI